MGELARLNIRLAKVNSDSFQMPSFLACLNAFFNFSSAALWNWAVFGSTLVLKVNEMQIKSKDAEVCVHEKHKWGQWKMKEEGVEKYGSRKSPLEVAEVVQSRGSSFAAFLCVSYDLDPKHAKRAK